ncbi:hypothetical protein BDF14DRAFT_140553 [Spinellus fusiger]|nr:hypothetical protein BDF14DRAFT_140553 [Spinellus fusiger]
MVMMVPSFRMARINTMKGGKSNWKAQQRMSFLEGLGQEHVITHTETTTGFLGNGELITSNHLHLHTESNSTVNGFLGVRARGVIDGEETNETHAETFTFHITAGNFIHSHSQSTETTTGKFIYIIVQGLDLFFGLVAGAEIKNGVGHAFGATENLAIGHTAVGDFSTLVDGVEGLELEFFNALTRGLGVGQGVDNAEINGILVLSTGRVGRETDDVVATKLGVGLDSRLVYDQLVQGQGTGLVRAEDGDSSHFLDGSDAGDNGLVFSQLLGTNGKSDGQDSRHGNGDTTNEQDKHVVNTTAVGVVEGSHDQRRC